MALKMAELMSDVFQHLGEEPENQQPLLCSNFCGHWQEESQQYLNMVNPLNANKVLTSVPNTQIDELDPFIESLGLCPVYGLHNPLYRPERYKFYGEICAKAAEALSDQENADYLAKLVNLVMPKGNHEAMAEVVVVRDFLRSLAGDGVRFLAQGVTTPGDRCGQTAIDYRWPFGPVVIITPFNFPLEIPALQLLGALVMGNKPVLRPDPKVAPVAEAFVRLLLACGMPAEDMCLLNGKAETAEYLVTHKVDGNFLVNFTQFTGSTKVAKRLLRLTNGRIGFEDAGYGWKLLGPNLTVGCLEIGVAAKQSDKDAYAAAGQKCSAQSLVVAHNNWVKAGFFEMLSNLAKQRQLSDLSISPILTWNDKEIDNHVKKLLKIPGSYLLFGGEPAPRSPYLIPNCYGCYLPTAVFVPLSAILKHFHLVTTEVFAPVQIVTSWHSDSDLDQALNIFNRLKNNNKLTTGLTAGVVDSDERFINYVVGRTAPGTTYSGMLGRTTGAPQWHWFGAAGHPAAAGIGTPEAIRKTWSCQRVVVRDIGD